MSVFGKSKVTPVIEAILRQKFGALYDWQKPEIEETVGPYHPAAFDSFAERLDLTVSQAHIALQSYPASEISLLHDRNTPDPEQRWDAWNRLFISEYKQLNREKPHWLAGGFGHPDYQADFEYWGQMEEFDLHEALMLSVGVEPKHFGEQELESAKKALETTELIAPIDFLVRRHEQFLRKYPTGMYGLVRATPDFLYNWFTDIKLAVHPNFLDGLRRRVGGSKKNQASEPLSNAVGTKADKREVDMIAQLFAAMAIDSFGYDPNAKRSPVPKEITDMAAEMGLSVTDDTVRKYLKLGARFIPDDWKPS